MENENKLNANIKINYVSNKLNDKLDSKNKMTQLGLVLFFYYYF